MKRIYTFFAGRKQTDKYLAVVLVSVAGAFLDASFIEYAGVIAAILVGGAFATAWEDRGRPAIDRPAN